MIVVLMGVSGSGKTTIGTLFAKRSCATFADADDYHPSANKQKMTAGHPLTDEDRQPWLEQLNALLQQWFHSSQSGVLACSALRQQYRETLSAGIPQGTISFCLLEASRELLAHRLEERQHEFMTPKLLDSQLVTFETPKDAWVVKNDRTPDEVVSEILNLIASKHHS
jgi:gluconokinase